MPNYWVAHSLDTFSWTCLYPLQCNIFAFFAIAHPNCIHRLSYSILCFWCSFFFSLCSGISVSVSLFYSNKQSYFFSVLLSSVCFFSQKVNELFNILGIDSRVDLWFVPGKVSTFDEVLDSLAPPRLFLGSRAPHLAAARNCDLCQLVIEYRCQLGSFELFSYFGFEFSECIIGF